MFFVSVSKRIPTPPRVKLNDAPKITIGLFAAPTTATTTGTTDSGISSDEHATKRVSRPRGRDKNTVPAIKSTDGNFYSDDEDDEGVMTSSLVVKNRQTPETFTYCDFIKMWSVRQTYYSSKEWIHRKWAICKCRSETHRKKGLLLGGMCLFVFFLLLLLPFMNIDFVNLQRLAQSAHVQSKGTCHNQSNNYIKHAGK